MHESGLARMIFPEIMKEAKKKKLAKVKSVKIAVGEMFTVQENLLKHSLQDHLFPGSIAAGATVEIVVEEIKASCTSCGEEISDKTALDNCPVCNADLDVDIVTGDKMRILEVR